MNRRARGLVGAAASVRGLVCAVLLAALMLPGAAHAEEQPAILKAYDLDWIERVREEAWPQPKAQRPVICLLDTGVDVTPDTPADNPDGPIVARLALDGGTGLAQGTTWEHQHGTQMASIIAAPRNNYGTVGVFPQARIVSIRVTDKTQDEVYITPGAVARGARLCGLWAEEQSIRIGSVVVAESNYSQRTIDLGFWDDAERRVRPNGGVLFAAVGNDVTATTVPPLASSSVIPVLAGDAGGKLCPFSPPLAAPLSVVAPGCQSAPWPDGSSQATAVAGAVFAAYVTRNPDADVSVAKNALGISPGAAVAGGSWKATMGALTEQVPVQLPQVEQTTTRVTDAADPVEVRLWRPRVEVTFRAGRVTIRRLDRRGGILCAMVGQRVRTTTRRSLTVRLAKRPRLIATWVTASDGRWRSLTRRQPVI